MGKTAKTHEPTPCNPRTPGSKAFYPHANPPVGTALSSKDWPQNETLPKLFEPITIAGMEFKNRIFVAPMCEYSCETGTGMPSEWHSVHLGALAVRGPALVMTEAAAVLKNGRISPEDLGIWNDDQRDALARIVKFIKAQGARAGIQLAHAGRKASTLAPWLDTSTMSANVDTHIATLSSGGWEDVWAPSSIPFMENTYPDPVEMRETDIEELKKAWVAATKRSDEAGFEVLEVHAAHGYLLHNFLSPVSNKRQDKYGGSLENRMRLALEIISLVREHWPKEKPLFLRISASDWHPDGEKNDAGEWQSWGVEQSKELVAEAIKLGVALVDVSSGGNYSGQKIKIGPGYQVPFADEIRASLTDANRIPISSVGLITEAKQAEEILQKGQSDIITVAREFLRHADLVYDWAQDLGVVVNVPLQYQRAYTRMMSKPASDGELKHK